MIYEIVLIREFNKLLNNQKDGFFSILLLGRTKFMNNLKLTLHDNRIEMSRIGGELCYNVIREGKNNFSGRNIK